MQHIDSKAKALVTGAIENGATGGCLVDPAELVVEEKLAGYCREPRCPNYGSSASCPPHVEGPEAMRKWCQAASLGLVVWFDVPVEILHSVQRYEVMQLLHQVVAKAERYAVELGYPRAKGFAGGSCRQIFCSDHNECAYLLPNGACRNPGVARPSMSGFGVDVGAMMKLAGRPEGKSIVGEGQEDGMSWVAGLVLIF